MSEGWVLNVLPPLPTIVFVGMWFVLFLVFFFVVIKQMLITMDAIRKGEIKNTVLPPTVFGMPTNEAVWKAVRQRAKAGDAEAVWLMHLGWILPLALIALILYPKA